MADCNLVSRFFAAIDFNEVSRVAGLIRQAEGNPQALVQVALQCHDLGKSLSSFKITP